MTRRASMDETFARHLEPILHDLAETGTLPERAARLTARHGSAASARPVRARREVIRAAAVTAAVAAVVTGVAATAVLAPWRGGAPANPPAATPPATGLPSPAPSLLVDGQRLLWAGTSPFGGVVAASSDARSVVVQITQLPTDGPFFPCTELHYVPLVHREGAVYTVAVATYAPAPGPTPGMCTGGLDASVPVTVRLPGAAGDRPFIDAATGKAHTVLDASTVPRPAADALPVGAREQPIHWNDTTGVAWRRWQAGSANADHRDVWLSLGSAGAIAAGAPTPSRTSTAVRIGTATGRLWHGRSGALDIVVIRWLRDGRTVEIRTVWTTAPESVQVALAIARSVH